MASLEEEGHLLGEDVEPQTFNGKRKTVMFVVAAAVLGFAAVAWRSQSEKHFWASPAKIVGLYSQFCYKKLDDTYMGGYAGGVSTSWGDLDTAKEKCNTISACNGVTCSATRRRMKCTVRRGPSPNLSPTHEVTHQKVACPTTTPIPPETTTIPSLVPEVAPPMNLVPATAPEIFLAFKLKNDKGSCLGASGNRVEALTPCPNTKQVMWSKYLSSLRSASSGKCLTWSGGPTLILDHCGNVDGQGWHFDGSQLHAVSEGEKKKGSLCASGNVHQENVGFSLAAKTGEQQPGCSWAMLVVISSFDYVQTPGTAEVRVTSPCSQFICEPGYLPKVNTAVLSGSRREECCVATCRIWSGSCPAGNTLIYAPHKQRGNDEGTCCRTSCSSMSCPAGHIKVRGSDFIISSTTEDCCVKSCKGFPCPAGTFAILKEVPGHTREQCCYEVQADEERCNWAKYTNYALTGHHWSVSVTIQLQNTAFREWKKRNEMQNGWYAKNKMLCKMYGVVLTGDTCAGVYDNNFYSGPLTLIQKIGAVAWVKEPSCTDGIKASKSPRVGYAFDSGLMDPWYLPLAFDFNVYRGQKVTRTKSSQDGRNPDMTLNYASHQNSHEIETFTNGHCSAVITYKCWRGADSWVGKHEESGCKYVSQLWSDKNCDGPSKSTFSTLEVKFSELDE